MKSPEGVEADRATTMVLFLHGEMMGMESNKQLMVLKITGIEAGRSRPPYISVSSLGLNMNPHHTKSLASDCLSTYGSRGGSP